MQNKIDETILGLKDFQKKSVDYAMDLLYNQGASKILIADEVGLGKTIVAKGIIAKAYEKYLSEIVTPKIPIGATVFIQGHTDIIGEENTIKIYL